jgi:hypothetical protein
MQVGVVPNPRSWERWQEAEALLEPARARGDFPSVLSGNEILFGVLDGDELLAVATAWLSTEGYVEIKLVGGRDHRRWLKQLDEAIGAAAREAGASRLVGIGRAGWLRELRHLGWDRIGAVEDHWLYAREL